MEPRNIYPDFRKIQYCDYLPVTVLTKTGLVLVSLLVSLTLSLVSNVPK